MNVPTMNDTYGTYDIGYDESSAVRVFISISLGMTGGRRQRKYRRNYICETITVSTYPSTIARVHYASAKSGGGGGPET